MTQQLAPDLFRQEYEQRLAAWSDIQDHMPFLYETACSYKRPRILELGTRSGNSTSCFLAAIHEYHGQLISVDINKPDVPDWWRFHAGWMFIKSDDIDPELVKDITTVMPRIDVLFIDTSHAYYHTIRELETWVPFVRGGGIVLMHDTEYDPTMSETGGVPQPRWPVAVALNHFCHDNGLKWENHTGCNGLGIIRIPEETHGASA